jgi:hypothetical protein
MLMANFTLCCGDAEISINKKPIFTFFEQHPDLFMTASYRLQTQVPRGIFLDFASSLTSSKEIEVNSYNASYLRDLGVELCLPELVQRCEPILQMDASDQLRERISRVELLLEVGTARFEFADRLDEVETALEALSDRINRIERQVWSSDVPVLMPARPRASVGRAVPPRFLEWLSDTETQSGPSSTLPSLSVTKQLQLLKELQRKRVELAAPKPGIIGSLTQRCDGNVCANDVVAMTASSLLSSKDECAVKNAADLGEWSAFVSQDAEDQWIMWDFKETLVKLTHYRMKCSPLRSWILEASRDAESWVRLDEKVNNQELNGTMKDMKEATFPVASQDSFRFIRLRQTGENHFGDEHLVLTYLEFFGKLKYPGFGAFNGWESFTP